MQIGFIIFPTGEQVVLLSLSLSLCMDAFSRHKYMKARRERAVLWENSLSYLCSSLFPASHSQNLLFFLVLLLFPPFINPPISLLSSTSSYPLSHSIKLAITPSPISSTSKQQMLNAPFSQAGFLFTETSHIKIICFL